MDYYLFGFTEMTFDLETGLENLFDPTATRDQLALVSREM